MQQARFVLSGVPQSGWVWRLLSRNNRQLGRSARYFTDLDEASAAAASLQASLERCKPLLERLPYPTRWIWIIHQGGVAQAMSGRSYEVERVALQGLELFLAGMAKAPLPAPAGPPDDKGRAGLRKVARQLGGQGPVLRPGPPRPLGAGSAEQVALHPDDAGRQHLLAQALAGLPAVVGHLGADVEELQDVAGQVGGVGEYGGAAQHIQLVGAAESGCPGEASCGPASP